MPHTTLRSHTVLPVRVTSPAWVSRRQTSPIVRRSRPTQSKTWRTTRGGGAGSLLAGFWTAPTCGGWSNKGSALWYQPRSIGP